MAETWILYRTTNLVNSKIYVGVHKLQNTSKSRCYLGSGYGLKSAIKKYGRDKFTRITLAKFNCFEDAYFAEAEMVTQEFIDRPDTYNMCLGGRGGGIQTPEILAKMSAANIGKKLSEETKAKIRAANLGNKYTFGKKHTEEAKEKIRAANLGRLRSEEQKLNYSKGQLGNTKWLGKHHTEESKAKISAANKGHTRNAGKILTAENKAKLIASNIGRVKSEEELAKLRAANTGANNAGSVAVMVNGVYYSTRKFAAEAENVSPPTVSDRIKSPKSKWDGWRLATDEEKLRYNADALQ
jgi:hypothetical protein